MKLNVILLTISFTFSVFYAFIKGDSLCAVCKYEATNVWRALLTGHNLAPARAARDTLEREATCRWINTERD